MKKIETRWRVYAFFLAIIAFPLLFLTTKHWTVLLYNEVNSSNWVKVQGKVTQFKMLTKMSGRRGDRHRYQMFKPRVAYKYQWDGKVFFGSRLVWSDYFETSETDSEQALYVRGVHLKRAYEGDSNIDIYINPKNPDESIIYRGSAWNIYITGFFLSFFAGLPFFGLIYLTFCKTWFFLR